MEIVLGLVIAVVMGIACAVIAGNKGRRGGLWFVLGFLFSLISLVIILILPRKN